MEHGEEAGYILFCKSLDERGYLGPNALVTHDRYLRQGYQMHRAKWLTEKRGEKL